LDECSVALYQAQDKATQDYQQDQENFRLATRRAALAQAALWAVLGILAVGLLLQLTKRFHLYPVRPLGIIIATCALTVVLFSYQAFEILGGAIAGLILLIVALVGLSIYIRQMEKLAAPKKAAHSTQQSSGPLAARTDQANSAGSATAQKEP
jgi:hypothetical protein